MNTLEMVVFLVIFVSIVLYSARNMAKFEEKREKEEEIDDGIKEVDVEKLKSEVRRQQFESQNEEFEYGHGITHELTKEE